jgi:hypothetical protein
MTNRFKLLWMETRPQGKSSSLAPTLQDLAEETNPLSTNSQLEGDDHHPRKASHSMDLIAARSWIGERQLSSFPSLLHSVLDLAK